MKLFSSHQEMRRYNVCHEEMSLFLSKQVENSCIGTPKVNNIDVMYTLQKSNEKHVVHYQVQMIVAVTSVLYMIL